MLYGLLRHFAPRKDKARHCEPHGGAAIQAMLAMNKSLTIILKRKYGLLRHFTPRNDRRPSLRA